MFDVSARPYVPGSTLSFAMPMKKFSAMINDMDESFHHEILGGGPAAHRTGDNFGSYEMNG
jgi:hypothetical protein